MRQRSLLIVSLGVLAVIVLTVLGAAAVTGQAATTQQVSAELLCEPGTVKPEQGQTVGCTLKVMNDGGNAVNKVVATIKATGIVDDVETGGEFLSTSGSLPCSGVGTDTLTCNINKLAAGAFVNETHEVEVPTAATSFEQVVTGQYSSPTGNNRGSATILPVTKETNLDSSDDYDGRFANADNDSVGTAGELSDTNPYVTSATVNGLPFEVGLEVREHGLGPGDDINCSASGCLGDQVLEFSITELVNETPDTYTLEIRVAGEFVGNTKVEDLIVRHDGVVVPFDPEGDPLTEVFIFHRTKDPSTKDVTFIIKGPGELNGGWGVGGPS